MTRPVNPDRMRRHLKRGVRRITFDYDPAGPHVPEIVVGLVQRRLDHNPDDLITVTMTEPRDLSARTWRVIVELEARRR